MAILRGATRSATFLGIALLGASLVACASIVGADFDSEHGAVQTADAASRPDDGSAPTLDAPPPTEDAPAGFPPPDGGSCPPRFLNCGGECFDISTSPLHCGTCATTCAGDPHGAAVCVASHCELACNDGYAQCASGCCAVMTTDGSVRADASSDDGGAGSDAAATDGGPPATIPCASASCPAGPTFCCGGATSGNGNPVGDTCVPTQNDTSGLSCPYVIACASTADCQGPGGVCCYDPDTNTQDPNFQSSFCAPDCGGNNSGYLQLCAPAANDCLGGESCTGVLTGQGLQTSYAYCQ